VSGVSPTFKWVHYISYEILEKKFNKAKIIVFLDGIDEEYIRIIPRGKELYLYGTNGSETFYAKIRLWFRIKSCKHVVRNGILTIFVKGKRLPGFLPF